MNYGDRITVATDVLVGKPIIKGTRIAVEFIIGLLANGWSHEDILACLSYASSVLQAEKVYPLDLRL